MSTIGRESQAVNIADSETTIADSETEDAGDAYSSASCIHAVTVFPVCCLNAALKVL